MRGKGAEFQTSFIILIFQKSRITCKPGGFFTFVSSETTDDVRARQNIYTNCMPTIVIGHGFKQTGKRGKRL